MDSLRERRIMKWAVHVYWRQPYGRLGLYGTGRCAATAIKGLVWSSIGTEASRSFHLRCFSFRLILGESSKVETARCTAVIVAARQGLLEGVFLTFPLCPLSRWPLKSTSYWAILSRRLFPILEMCPNQCSCDINNLASILAIIACSRNSMLVT